MPSPPLSGRRLWFAGIGGAGLSAYALLAKAWGAEVAGWDPVDTPYLEHVRAAGIDVVVAPEPAVPDQWEAVVSTAYRDRVDGRTRAELLAELVGLRDAIVVAGAHGKTTTAAMIAFVLDRLGLDPAYVIGGDVPQLGGNAGTGEGWLVVEGDESDRTIAALRPRIAVVTNVDLDHHSEFASRAEVAALFDEWLAGVPTVVRGDELPPLDAALAVPGEHNRRNAAAALAALEAAGVERERAVAALTEFAGVGRRLERRGEAGGVAVYDDYAHNPPKVEAAIDGAARDRAADACSSSSSRTCRRARGTWRASSAPRSPAPTRSRSPRSTRRASRCRTASTGRAVVEAILDRRPGMAVAWTPDLADGVHYLARHARRRRRGRDRRRRRRRPRRAAAARGARVNIEEGVALSRFTTLGTGGPARWFARPETVARAGGGARLGACARRGRGGRRARLEPARRRRGRRRAGAEALRRARRRCDRGRAARRGRRRAARRVPAPRPRRRARRARVRLRHPRDGRAAASG